MPRTNIWLPIGIPLDTNPVEIPIVNLRVKGKRYPFAEVLFTGCKHFGHEDQSLNQLTQHLLLLQKVRHMVGVDMGDIVDLARFRTNYLGETSAVSEQINQAAQYLKPIAHKIAIALYGNHDARLSEQMLDAFNWLEVFWKGIGGDPYIKGPGRGMLAVFKVGGQEYPVYSFHSRTGAIVNEFLALQRAGRNWNVPLIVGGHVHRLGYRDMTSFAPTKVDGTWYQQVYRTKLLLTGCFMKYPAYSEEKAYPLTDVGAPVVRFHQDRFQIEIIEPRTHYPEFFDEDAVEKYEPDKEFSFKQKHWKWKVRKQWELKEEGTEKKIPES